MKKKIAIINNPTEFEDFVNREDIEIISVDIKVVEQSFLYQQGFAGVVYYYEIDKAIQALSQSEWVSVEDRLPELVGNKYLIYCGKEYKIAEYLAGNFWDDDFGTINEVTHWTPIFKAPQTK